MGKGSRRHRSKAKKRVTRQQVKKHTQESGLMPGNPVTSVPSGEKIPHREYTTTITPEMAQGWLKNNPINRDISWKHVAALQQAMEDGSWQDDIGCHIRLDWFGRVIDGQHRLLACVGAKRPFPATVVEGLNPRRAEVIDTNIVRSGHDAVAMRQKERGKSVSTYSRPVGTAAMIVKAFDETGNVYYNYETRVAQDQADAVDTYPELFESAELTKSTQGTLQHSISIALHYLFSRTKSCSELATEFFEKIGTGANCPKGDPALTLRNRLLSFKTGKAKLQRNYAIAMTIKAWEAYLKGDKLNKFVISPDNLPQVKTGYQNKRVGHA